MHLFSRLRCRRQYEQVEDDGRRDPLLLVEDVREAAHGGDFVPSLLWAYTP